MRYLAIDLGERRTGLAVGDSETGIVTPLEVVEAPQGPGLLARVRAVMQTHTPQAIVLGLPLNMDGTEGPAARAARRFGADLEADVDAPVHYQDERLTSHAANEQMARSGLTRGRKKKIRDALAAAEILRDYLAARS